MTDKIVLNVPKMNCEGCISNITRGLNEIGLTELDFDLSSKNVSVNGEHLNEKEILKTLKRINYPATIV